MTEAQFQTKVIKYVRSKKCWAMKVKPGLGIPTGTADIFFCKEGFYGWMEVKAAKNSKKQPGQEQFVKKMDGWSWAKFVYPENWSEVKLELDRLLAD